MSIQLQRLPIAILFIWLMVLPAVAQKRIALLIGNQGYVNRVGPLENPFNDVAVVDAALKKVGFEVMPPVLDGSRAAILIAVHEFADRLKQAGDGAVGFLYYSGYGVALGVENYLIPTDISSISSRAIKIGGVSQRVSISDGMQASVSE